MTHSPNTAQAAVPDAVGLPAQRWKTCAASLPHDAASFPIPEQITITSVSASVSGTSRPSALPVNSGELRADGRAFYSQLCQRVSELQRRADVLKGKVGYHAMLERLTQARTAKLLAELQVARG